ncbi:hypothetical protein Tco_1395672 [Tanacetum coccineum]
MDEMIKEKLELKEQVDSLEQNLCKQIKEKECLLQTFNVFKSESKEKEDKYMENEIDLEKKIKELDNILFKVGQSAQTMHMLTKPQAFYDNIHKQDLAPKDLPKVSLVNEICKQLKFHLARFDNVVKIRTTPDARTEEQFNSIKKTRVRTKEQSDSLIDKLNLKSAENDDLKAQIQDKVFVITSLKNDLRKVKGKEIVDIVAQIPSAYTIVPDMFKLDLEHLSPWLLQNREAHIEYLKYTQEQANILREIVEQAKAKQPLDKELDFALQKMLLSHLKTRSRKLGLKCSSSNYRSKLTCNKKNDRISRTPSRNIKNKVEAQPRKVNKKNSVVKPIRDVDVKHSLFNANFEPICATCKKSMFVGFHDMCLLDFVINNFTIVGNSCPLTRITSTNVVPPKKTTSHSVETQKPELKVCSRKPKNVNNVGSSKKAKTVESKNANNSKPNHTWGSNATDISSSSSLVMIGCLDCSLVSGLWMFEIDDREPLSTHELC